jgi:uncharacterized protein (TIGR02996 family)
VAEDDAVAALFQQVYAQPDDDHIRLVLADALTSLGDPRGELIQVQLQPETDHERRAMLLIQQYGLTWLGPLVSAVVPLAYERGFLASCLVVGDAAAVADRDEWSTVHTIELPPDDSVKLVLHPVMRSLRRLVGVTPGVLLNLAKHRELARIAVEIGFHRELVKVLGYLPPNAVGTLTVHRVPADQQAELRSAASRHKGTKLDLRVVAASSVEQDPDDERYDDIDE